MKSSQSHSTRLIAFPIVLFSLLISISMVSYLYLTELTSFSTFFVQPKYSDPNAMPWEETFLIRNEALYGYDLQTRQIYSPEQPKITKTIIFKTRVYQKRYKRGEIVLYIDPKGDIKGSWSADFTVGSRYSPQQINYITLDRTTGRYPPNTFRGNLAPSKIYQDENGQDKSKLYFITNGEYLLEAQDLRTNDVRNISGDIYVTGWIDPNYNAIGELNFTSMWSEAFPTFYWEATPSDSAE
jgi:hypothetical protein